MAVARRLRFEILRRDNHTCRYCGASAPDVKLTVDHVVPEALGGSDDPTNLVTACDDCNGGKSSIAPDQATVADVASDALRWKRATEWAAARLRIQDTMRREAIRAVLDAWDNRYGWIVNGETRRVPSDDDREITIGLWIDAGLTERDLLHFVAKAMASKAAPREKWRYFAGCCWSRLREIREIAAAALAEDEEAFA